MPSLRNTLIGLALLGLIIGAALIVRHLRKAKAKFEIDKKQAFQYAEKTIKMMAGGDTEAYIRFGRDDGRPWMDLTAKYANTDGWAELVNQRVRAITAYLITTEKEACNEVIAAFKAWMNSAEETSAYDQLTLFTKFLALRRKLIYSIGVVNRAVGDENEMKRIADGLLTRSIVELRTSAETGSRDSFDKAQALLKAVENGYYHGIYVTDIKPGDWGHVQALYLLRIGLTESDRSYLGQFSPLLAAREALASGEGDGSQLNIWLIKAVLAWALDSSYVRSQIGEQNLNALADLVLYHARLTRIPLPV